MSELYDLIIAGAGPAGMTAAIYARRAELKVLLIEKNYMGGGQIINTYEIDNYPGLPGLSGMELATKMSEHVDKYGTERVQADITGLELTGDIKKVNTEQGSYEGKAVILTTGNSPGRLNVKGEEELAGMGVSYCATCDGAFFKNRTVAVIGGGDVAVEDAIFLARGCKKVYIIHRRDELRAAKTLQTALFACDNIEPVWNSVVKEIAGGDMVEKVIVTNVKDGTETELLVNGVFIAVGNVPNSSYIIGKKNRDELKEGELLLDEKGYVVAGEDCATSIPGVFAAGDLRSKPLRQVVTAVSDGANAVYSAEKYLVSLS
ncbi:MAG: thioredoxin-disulfide reductase [Lachnospiraceae bacterium]|nr:thioredoxin-disulfide reductase [Lachnospiraceae bacterium]